MVELKRLKNKDELKRAILECWDEIPLSFIRSCIDGLPNKMEKVLENAIRKLPAQDMEKMVRIAMIV